MAVGVLRNEDLTPDGPIRNLAELFPHLSSDVINLFEIKRAGLNPKKLSPCTLVQKISVVKPTASVPVFCFRFKFSKENSKMTFFPGDHVILQIDLGEEVVSRPAYGEFDVGSKLSIRGPFPGPKTLIHSSQASGCYPSLVLITAGTGAAVALLMLDYYRINGVYFDSLKQKKKSVCTLLSMHHTESDCISKSAFDEFSKQMNLKVVYGFSKSESSVSSPWNGYISREMVTRLIDINESQPKDAKYETNNPKIRILKTGMEQSSLAVKTKLSRFEEDDDDMTPLDLEPNEGDDAVDNSFSKYERLFVVCGPPEIYYYIMLLMNQREKYLLFGDEINFTPCFHEKDKNYLISNGAVKNQAFVFGPNVREAYKRAFNHLQSVFRIEPQLSWKAAKAHQEAAKSKLQLDCDLFYTQFLETSNGLENLVKAAEMEMQANKTEYSRMKGKPEFLILVIEKYFMDRQYKFSMFSTTSISQKTGTIQILPKFRIRVEGEPVRIGDSVILQSIKTDSYLNLLHESFYDKITKFTLSPVVMSGESLGWNLGLFQSDRESKPSRAVYAGQLIRIYHKEKEGYISVPASLGLPFDLENEINDTESDTEETKPKGCVQLQNFILDPLNPCESSSANVFWQLEFSDAHVGGTVDWGRPCRIRHVSTNMYLQVTASQSPRKIINNNDHHIIVTTESETNEFTVSLTKFAKTTTADGNGDSTLFIFIPVNSDHQCVSTAGYGRIQHLITRTWLGSGTSFPESDSIVTASIDRNIADYFSFSIVETTIVKKVSFLTSIIPVLMESILKIRIENTKSAEMYLSAEEEALLTKIFTSLIFFCTKSTNFDPFKREGTPEEGKLIDILGKHGEIRFYFKAQQILIRELGIIDMALILLQIPFSCELRRIVRDQWESINSASFDNKTEIVSYSIDNTDEAELSYSSFNSQPENHGVVKILKYLYRFIRQFLLGNNHLNQLHVATHYDTLSTISLHLSLNVGAADALMQLMSGNEMIVRSISDQQIRKFVNLLIEKRDPVNVGFLVSLCNCKGNPVRRNQMFIAELLIEHFKHSDIRSEVFHKTRVRGGNIEIFSSSSEGNENNEKIRTWAPLLSLFSEIKQVGSVTNSRANKMFLETESTDSLVSTSRIDLNLIHEKPLNRMKSTECPPIEYTFGENAKYFESTLQLFHALSAGCNNTTMRILVSDLEQISLDECMVGVMDEQLPFKIRALYCNLLQGLFIDKLSNPQQLFSNIYSVSATGNMNSLSYENKNSSAYSVSWMLREARSERTNPTKLDNRTATVLIEWVIAYLKHYESTHWKSEKSNYFLLSVLQLVKYLYIYGYFTTLERITVLTQSLINVLELNSDIT
ncbi:hypothetical protein HK098_005785 [Nowakowskiella sp. JEL0407]|nr:hypothetical protein HK098_005785 [Nowakowskiella sp. JEL0407]